jgi:penicillin amidase
MFDPTWKAKNVSIDRHELDDALGQDLEAQTLTSAGAIDNPLGTPMRSAFHDAFASLSNQLGGDPGSWTWGKLHTRTLENLAQISGLNYGPRPDRGDGNTPLAAGGDPSTHGPSWRMVVDWGTKTFNGIYPGGQSENPASTWYTNKVDTWWSGLLTPMLSADEASFAPGVATWSMQP